MSIMDWDESLSVSIPEFDAAHKKLISIINELHESMRQGKGKEKVAALTNELSGYAREHFSQEEDFMKKNGYAGLVSHAEAHKAFAEKISVTGKELNAGRPGVAIELLDFLRSWVIEHIKEVDSKYSAAVADKTV
ncbi:MAG: bacteriohemerythrin [Spirochaetes bacterium]|nr:bacteriohemerythrin [Spirochaetota bacterium]